MTTLLWIGLAAGVGGAVLHGGEEVEATSLFGKPLMRPLLTESTKKAYEEQLAKAQTEYAADPGNVDKAIWVGRRIAYLGRFRESIKFYSLALERFPGEPKLLRHRGHRYLTTRDFQAAVADFELAAKNMKGKPDEVEPDGQPNARNIPIGSLHSNVWYHLGLAYFLLGDLEKAAEAYEECQKTSANDDRLVSTSYWQALTLAKLHRTDALQALLRRIHKDLKVIENDSYHQLLLYFKGEVSQETLLNSADSGNAKATLGFGIAAWRILNGQGKEGTGMLKDILKGSNWTSFGYIGAESELKRQG